MTSGGRGSFYCHNLSSLSRDKLWDVCYTLQSSQCIVAKRTRRLNLTINFKITSFTRLLVALKLLYLFWWQVMTSRDRVINADFVLFSCRLQTMCYLTKKKILPAKSRPSWLKWVFLCFACSRVNNAIHTWYITIHEMCLDKAYYSTLVTG